jgi:enoyl-CoA hydratase
MNRAFFDTAAAIHHFPVPVISAVHGHALGAGLAMAGASDIIVAAEGARFGLPEVNVGLLGGASHALRILPLAKVRTMYFTGEPITAEEMYRLGAVETVVPHEDLLPVAEDLAGRIASKPSRTLRFAKQAMNGIEPVDLEKNYRFEQGFTFEITHSGVGE